MFKQNKNMKHEYVSTGGAPQSGHHMCQGLHLGTEVLYGLAVLIVCSWVSWLVITLPISCLYFGTICMCCLLRGELVESALMFILITYDFYHLTEDFLISNLAVWVKRSQSLSEVSMYQPRALVYSVEKDFLNGLRVVGDVCVGLPWLKKEFLLETNHTIQETAGVILVQFA